MGPVPLLNSLLAVSALILVYWAVNKIFRRGSLPPGPPGWPIIGNLLDMPKDFEWIKYKDLSERYTSQDSDIIYLNVLGTSIVVLSSLKAINDLMDGRAAIYSDRPTSIMVTELMGWRRALPMMPYGDVWRSQRRAFHREFQPQAVSRYHPKQIKVTHSLLRRLLVSPQRWYEHIQHEAGAAIMDIAYGIEVLPENDPYIQKAEAALESVHRASTPGAFLVDVFPPLKFVPAWVPGAGFQRKAAKWKKLLGDVIEMPYAVLKKQMADGIARPSFVSRSLSLMDATGNLEQQENIIRDTAGMVYTGGSDTIRSTTNAFMQAVLMHPEVQVRAQAELDLVIGKGQLPTFADRDALPYITAIVKETLRWQPVAPVSVPRQVRESDEYKGYYIPKGSIVMANSWAILHDQNMYPDPFAFKPERFIKDGRLDPSIQDPEVAAFGYARRICPGKAMGFDSVWLNVASILAAFDIKRMSNPLNENVVEPKFLAHGISCRSDNFMCDITPRSKEIAELIQTTAHMD